MNAISDNDFSQEWKRLGETIERPRAILAISAHWLSRSTAVTAMTEPRTIHDFYGFPEELFSAQYAAPGNPAFAQEVADLLVPTAVTMDQEWGLDHGTWSVLTHMYADASIPVVQLSLNVNLSAEEHYELGKRLQPLRENGVLIMGSGDIVHNLSLMNWAQRQGFDWAQNVNEQVKEWIQTENHTSIIQFDKHGDDFKKAIPTPDHFWPLLYILGASRAHEKVEFFTDSIPFGAISMTGVKIG